MIRHDVKSRKHTFQKMALSGLLMAVLAVLPAASAFGQPKNEPSVKGGWLYVYQFFSPEQMNDIPGFVPSKVWIYDEKGQMIDSKQGSGQFPTGILVPVPEGWYEVEIGHEHAHGNAWKYYVQTGKVTIIQTGFVKVTSMSPEMQKPDICNPWNATMKIFVKNGDKMEFLATNKA